MSASQAERRGFDPRLPLHSFLWAYSATDFHGSANSTTTRGTAFPRNFNGRTSARTDGACAAGGERGWHVKSPFSLDESGLLLAGKWSGRRGSNPRRSAWEADILPLNYSRNQLVPFYPSGTGLVDSDFVEMGGSRDYSGSMCCSAWNASGLLRPGILAWLLLSLSIPARCAQGASTNLSFAGGKIMGFYFCVRLAYSGSK